MSITTGIIALIITIVGWGSYLVPMKRFKDYDPFCFQAFMCTSVFITSLIVSLVYSSFIFSYLGIISGILWACGNTLSIMAVRNSGLSKAAPVWMGTVIIISFAWGLLFFKEQLASWIAGTIGILALVVGIAVISLSSTTQDTRTSNHRGIVYSIAAGCMFASYLVPFKLSNLEPSGFIFSMSIGILAGGLAIFLVKKPAINMKIAVPGAFSGVIWNMANFASFYAVLILGMAVGYPLTQIALFVSVLWGLVYFREIQTRNEIIKLVIGAVILFSGAIALGNSM